MSIFNFISKKKLKNRIDILQHTCSELMDKNYNFSIRDSKYYKIIYNPDGENKWFINNDKTIYIQGKPFNLDGFIVDEIIALNKSNIDFEWFNKSIIPMGIKREVKIKYL